MSYTKGPWKIVSKGVTIYQIGPICAEEYAGESWLEVCRADANLISAAPELLESLEDLTSLYEDDEGCRELSQYKAAIAAIAKAKGE